jgi:hypothetical protein
MVKKKRPPKRRAKSSKPKPRAPEESPAAELAALPGERGETWFSRLSPDAQGHLLEVREFYLAGRLGQHSIAAIWTWCKSRFSGVCGKSQFSDWIKQRDGGDGQKKA